MTPRTATWVTIIAWGLALGIPLVSLSVYAYVDFHSEVPADNMVLEENGRYYRIPRRGEPMEQCPRFEISREAYDTERRIENYGFWGCWFPSVLAMLVFVPIGIVAHVKASKGRAAVPPPLPAPPNSRATSHPSRPEQRAGPAALPAWLYGLIAISVVAGGVFVVCFAFCRSDLNVNFWILSMPFGVLGAVLFFVTYAKNASAGRKGKVEEPPIRNHKSPEE